MKTNFTFILFALGFQSMMFSQQNTLVLPPGYVAQNEEEKNAVEYFQKFHPDLKDFHEFITAWRNEFNSGRLTQNPTSQPSPPTPMSSCTNVDFEAGNMNGWTRTTGFNPVFSAPGCCPNPGGAQLITSGSNLDPYGLFPTDCPGGNYSLKLGDSLVGGHADRIEQTFLVSSANTNYSYKYAVVLEDPGHPLAYQPMFTAELLDQNGNPIPCTFYQVSAGQNIPGFQNSQNYSGVIFKPWTTVAVDLTNYIGQNVTVRFTAYDCGYGGHFGYAYIDGSCLSFPLNQIVSMCSNAPTSICAPNGFASYVWNGPGINSATSQCISVNLAGTYSLQMISVTGCSTPVMTYTVNLIQAPTASFTPSQLNGCNSYLSFANNSNCGSSSCTYAWNFGDGDTSSSSAPSHTYSTYGTYSVSLIAFSSNGCFDTTLVPITLHAPPAVGMSFTGLCEGQPVQFQGTISGNQQNVQWLWSFGNSQSATLQNPNYTFPSWGSYPVSLSVTDSGCTTTITQAISIQPLPVLSISAAPVCAGITLSFQNNSFIPAGNITSWFWNFGSQGTSTLQNPSLIYNIGGIESITLSATSNVGCIATQTLQVQIFSIPQAAFSGSGACQNFPLSFLNQSSASQGSTLASNYWNFGDGNYSLAGSPIHSYSLSGTYSVSLTVTSNQGCSATVQLPVIIHPSPLAAFSSLPVCVNQNMNYTNQSSVSSGSIISWKWDFNNDGITDSYLQNPVATFTLGGNYQTKLTVATNNACTDSLLKPVTVYHNPNANFSAAAVCLGQPSLFHDHSLNQSGSISAWDWDFTGSGVFTNLSQNPTHTFPTAGLFLVTLQIQNNFGCMNQIKIPVRVNPTPVVAISASHFTGCAGEMCVGMINNSQILGGSIASWHWNFGDHTGSSQNSPTHCFLPGSYQVTLTAVSDSGCSSVATLHQSIVVYPSPEAGFVLSNNHPDVIDNQSEITSTATGATGFQYTISDGTTNSQPDFSHTFNSDQAATYTIVQIVVNGFGCRDTFIQVLELNPAFTFYIPNAFTPNGDGTNDFFNGKGIGIKEYSLWVFDRWGNQVYFTNSLSGGWDGTFSGNGQEVSLQDVFVWVVALRDDKNQQHDYKGVVSLVK